MKHALEPIGKSLIFSPCCRVTATGIQWTREPTEDELDADDYTVQRCDDSAGWWMGDVIVMRWKREGMDKTLGEFASEYARGRELNEMTVRKRAWVASFYPGLKRLSRPVGWSHHHIVWELCSGSGLDVCMDWLNKSKGGVNGEMAWSTGKLRAEIGVDKRRSNEEEEPPPPEGDFDWMVNVDCQAALHMACLDRVDSAHARDLLARFSSTVQFVDELRARANS